MFNGIALARFAVCRLSATVLLLVCVAAGSAAQARRAVLVGIQNYRISSEEQKKLDAKPVCVLSRLPLKGEGIRLQFGNLDGTINDVNSVKAILVGRLGFDPKNIVTLLDQEATADAILCSIQRQLVEAAQPGDVSVFYYAGHGSRIRNTKTDQADGYDQTIVPADSWRGTPDIRNKELSRLFRRAAAKGVNLTVIADSCHSGAIARGPLTSAGKARMLEPDPRYVEDPPDRGADGKPLPAPEDAYDNVIVFSAAQRDELAWESSDEEGNHGLFTWALTKVLKDLPDERADMIFQQVRSLMRRERTNQEPVLAGKGRSARTLFGQQAATGAGVTIAAGEVSEKEIILNGGTAVGLYKGCELKKLTRNPAEPPVRLRVEESSVASAKAVLIEGSLDAVHTSDLFAIEHWVVPKTYMLRAYIAPARLPLAQIQALVRRMAPLHESQALTWLDDPSVVAPTHIMSWDGSQWKLDATDPKGATTVLGPDPSTEQVLKALPAKPRPSLFLLLPPATEVVEKIQLGEGTPNNAVSVQRTPAGAHYLLVGRAEGETVEYAWIRPNMTEAQYRRNPDAQPLRSDWITVAAAEGSQAAADRLQELALRVGRLRAWLSLEGPPQPPDRPVFPYALAFQNQATKKLVSARSMNVGEKYDAVLAADPRLIKQYTDPSDLPRRYVYLVHISEWGESKVYFPDLAGGGEGNRLPLLRAGQDKPDEIIKLRGFTVTDPSPDTYYLLVTDERLGDPLVLETEPVRTRGAPEGLSSRGSGGSSPLGRLLERTGSATRGDTLDAVPANWSIQKVTIQCLAK
jgi:hypothetical protein